MMNFLLMMFWRREKEAPCGDGIVAVHLEDVRAGIDLQVERSVSAALERIARHAQLDLDAGTDVERQRDVHLAAGDGLLLAPAFEHHLPARQIIDRVGLGFSLKVTKSAYEILDLFDSGMKNDEWSSVEAAMSILTAPLSPEMRAVPEA